MGVEFIYPEFEVIRNSERCIACRVCERQCANGVHSYSEERKAMVSDETKCVNCQRCVSLCPTRALKIVKSDCRLRENANWQADNIKEIYLGHLSQEKGNDLHTLGGEVLCEDLGLADTVVSDQHEVLVGWGDVQEALELCGVYTDVCHICVSLG